MLSYVNQIAIDGIGIRMIDHVGRESEHGQWYTNCIILVVRYAILVVRADAVLKWGALDMEAPRF